jgi:hypothetical protein
LLNSKAGPGGSRKVMDMSDRVDAVGTLRAGLDLFPKTRRVFVIAGGRADIFPFPDGIKQEFAIWTNKVDIEYADDLTYEQLLRRAPKIPPDAIILYLPYFADASGHPFPPVEVLDKVCQEAMLPVFATLEVYLGRGIVGVGTYHTRILAKKGPEERHPDHPLRPPE